MSKHRLVTLQVHKKVVTLVNELLGFIETDSELLELKLDVCHDLQFDLDLLHPVLLHFQFVHDLLGVILELFVHLKFKFVLVLFDIEFQVLDEIQLILILVTSVLDVLLEVAILLQ